MKNNFFVTSAATKYWKKEVKNGRLHVATQGDKIYIVNSCSAFVIPNNQYIFAELVQPATMRPAPADGAAHIWRNGDFREDTAAGTVDLVTCILNAAQDAAPVERTRFSVDIEKDTHRVYKLTGGAAAMVNSKYDCMVDRTFRHTAKMANNKAPLILSDGEFTGILMPVHPGNLPGWIAELAAGGETK